jgi:hypothetical protein
VRVEQREYNKSVTAGDRRLIRRFMMTRLILGLGCCVLFLSAHGGARADTGDPFKLTLSEGYYYGQSGPPVDRVFRVRTGFPRTFYVTVINISSSTQEFYGDVASSGYSSIIFEITDGAGKTNVVRRKKDPRASSATAFSHLNPGESKYFEIKLNEEEWENAFKLYREGARRVKVRAIYDNNSSKIYSDYYEVIIVDSGGGQGEESSAKTESPTVLMSK